eukprot:scaffold3570_cov227-Amphora_coffeaeformis.AAC.15
MCGDNDRLTCAHRNEQTSHQGHNDLWYSVLHLQFSKPIQKDKQAQAIHNKIQQAVSVFVVGLRLLLVATPNDDEQKRPPQNDDDIGTFEDFHKKVRGNKQTCHA